MILAAGEGKRLRPLTETIPKILAPVLGLPMLDRLVAFLAGGGVGELAMNTHHLAGQASAHVKQMAGRHPAWPPIRLFHEPQLLDTGGGLANVADFWGRQPLLVWNGDVLAEIDLKALISAHEAGAGQAGGTLATQSTLPTLATLVVQGRESGSYLQVDGEGFVCGIDSPRRGDKRLLREPRGEIRRLAFNGISVLEPALRDHMPGAGAFDLINVLLDAVAAGAVVSTYHMEGNFWGTTGSLERLAALEAGLRERPRLLQQWGG